MATRPLRNELIRVLIIKLLLLTVLWWVWVRDAQVSVDAARAGTALIGGPPAATPPPGALDGH